MSSNGREVRKVAVRLKWDPSPWNESPQHLDIIAATYSQAAAYGPPAYVVHFDSRSPDGTVNMTRHSRTGQGFGYVEEMILELDRLAPSFARVVVGVAIHQNDGRKEFTNISNAGVLVVEGYEELLEEDFSQVSESCAATIAEFVRDATGAWTYQQMIRGFDSDPVLFAAEMGRSPQP